MRAAEVLDGWMRSAHSIGRSVRADYSVRRPAACAHRRLPRRDEVTTRSMVTQRSASGAAAELGGCSRRDVVDERGHFCEYSFVVVDRRIEGLKTLRRFPNGLGLILVERQRVNIRQ